MIWSSPKPRNTLQRKPRLSEVEMMGSRVTSVIKLVFSLIQTHLVVSEDEYNVRLLPLLQLCLVVLVPGLVLVWFRPVGTQDVQAAENTQHSQSGGGLHRYYRSPGGNKNKSLQHSENKRSELKTLSQHIPHKHAVAGGLTADHKTTVHRELPTWL